MKKLYSICLDEDLAEVFDDYCIKSDKSRSEIISKFIIEYCKNGPEKSSKSSKYRDNDSAEQYIEVINGAKVGVTYKINDKKSTVIGRRTRDFEPDIDLSEQLRQGEPAVSRQHAEFIWKQGDLYIKDMGSVNGTFVSGERIERQRQLLNGDRIKFANIEVRIVMK